LSFAVILCGIFGARPRQGPSGKRRNQSMLNSGPQSRQPAPGSRHDCCPSVERQVSRASRSAAMNDGLAVSSAMTNTSDGPAGISIATLF